MNRLHFQLSYKRLEKSKFCWPWIGPHRIQLNHLRLLALVDGLDWTKIRSVVVKRPKTVG
ncbi:IS66 family insertion sequence element accessory protein TnpB [Bradyrhizobium diazoefficiens]|nr:IS66 family insertion sequence element accessory protein TnpB [Bradyrhizobium diazoefficiens]